MIPGEDNLLRTVTEHSVSDIIDQIKSERLLAVERARETVIVGLVTEVLGDVGDIDIFIAAAVVVAYRLPRHNHGIVTVHLEEEVDTGAPIQQSEYVGGAFGAFHQHSALVAFIELFIVICSCLLDLLTVFSCSHIWLPFQNE